MYHKRIQNISEIPTLQKQRKCTDIACLLIWLVFTITLLITSIVMLNKQNLLKINFPTDSDNRTCGYQLSQFPYLYFIDPSGNNIKQRICVKECPTADNQQLMCSPTSTIGCQNLKNKIYDSKAQIGRLGALCIPKDKKLMQSTLLSYNLVDKWNFLKSLDVIKYSLLISSIFGICYLLFTQLFSNIIWIGMILGGVGLITLGILITITNFSSIDNYHSFIKYIGIIFIIIGLLLLGYIWWSSHQIKVCSVFISEATEFISNEKSILIYIPIFISATIGFIALIVFQYLSFSSYKDIKISANSIYWNGSHFNIFNVLNLIELFWGIFILRDSFNFIISGNIIQAYFPNNKGSFFTPFKRLFTKNLGSVISGAFLNCFFALPQLIFDILRPSEEGKCKSCVNPCFCTCGFLLNTFNLIRTDTYSYINFTGIPYCDSSRQCQKICHYSSVFQGSQSTIRVYRTGSHIMILSFAMIIGYFTSKSILLNNHVSYLALLCVLFITFTISTYFLLIHLDAAQAIMISFLSQYQLSNRNYYLMNYCSQRVKQRIIQLQNIPKQMKQ